MNKCLPGEHFWAWDANDCGPPPAGLRCVCGLRAFGAAAWCLPDFLRRWALPELPEGVHVLFDGRCERCRCPLDDHNHGMCPRFDYSK